MLKMEKAYDIKVLGSRLKARGLVIAEDALEKVLEESCDWLAESAEISKTPFDDIVAVAIPMVKKEALKAIDKIDGVEGNLL